MQRRTSLAGNRRLATNALARTCGKHSRCGRAGSVRFKELSDSRHRGGAEPSTFLLRDAVTELDCIRSGSLRRPTMRSYGAHFGVNVEYWLQYSQLPAGCTPV